jgi:hypothetical protein
LITKGDGAGNHNEPLGKSSHKNTDGESVDGALSKVGVKNPGEEQAYGDGNKVKGGGSKSGQTEVVEAVEKSHINGGKGKKQDEGKEDPGEFDREFQFSRYGSESWVEESDERIGKNDPGSDDEKEDNEKEGVDVAGESKGRLFSLLGQFLGEGGDESGREGSFGKKIPQEVGYAESGDEGIEFLACSEEGVEEDFADKPENAGGSDGCHHARCAFGAHFWFNLWTHADKTSSGVSRVMQRRSMGHVLRKQGLQETLWRTTVTEEPRGPVQAGSVEPKMATAGLRR